MAGTVVDALVVTLGLDSKGFADGVKGSSEQLAGFTRRLAGMFIGIKSLEGAIGYFKELHAQLAEIGFTSKNLGVAGTELKRLGEVSELFGGQMSDAADSVQGLQSAVFGLKYRGQMSESLMMLQRFGVAYLTASGHARDFKDIAMDAAKAIERQAKTAGMDKGERYQLAISMGFTGGVASAVAQGGKGLEDALKKSQVDQKSLTEKTIQGQVALEQQLVRQHEQLAAVNSTLLSTLTPAIAKLNEWMQQLINKAIPLLVQAINALINFFKNPPPWLALVEEALKGLAETLGSSGTLLTAIAGLATALVSLPLAIAGALGILLGTIIDKLFPSGGALNTITEKLLDRYGPGSGYDPNKDASGKPIPGTRGSHRTGVITRAPPTPTVPRPRSAAEQSAAAGHPTTMNTTGGNQVTIDTINVNTRATDAHGIASSIGGALQRKMIIGNADNGIS